MEDSHIADHDHSMVEEDHDRAFIHDSTIMGDHTDDTHSHSHQGTTTTAPESEEFKKPSGLPRWRDGTATDTSTYNSSEQESLDITTSSETSDSSVCTVIYNGQPLSSKPPVPKPPPLLKPRNSAASTSDSNVHSKVSNTKLKDSRDKYKSASSLDSGIDPGENTEEHKLQHSPSVGSMKSVDSGLDCEMDCTEEDSTCTSDRFSKNVSTLEEAGSVSAFSRNVARTQSFRASKEGAVPVMLRKSAERSSMSAKRNPTTMPVSAEMHHMLSRVGVVGGENKKTTKTAPFVALPKDHEDRENDDGDEGENIVRV